MGKHNKKDKKQKNKQGGSFVAEAIMRIAAKAIKVLTNKGKKYT
jgi:hypothetical protein